LKNKERIFRIWIGLLAVPITLGGYAAVVKFTSRGEIFGTTQLVPLGVLISTYIFFVVSSTGLCFITALGHVFGIKRFEPLVKRGVFLAIITLLCGFGAIGLELERPFRLMANNITSPQIFAPIWWMGTFYGMCLLLLLGEFVFLLKENLRVARILGLGAFLIEVLATSTLGSIFGLIIGKPYWYGAYMPIFFMLSAILSGTAFIMFFTIITYKITEEKIPHFLENLLLELGKFLAFFIGIIIFLYVWKVIMSLYGHPHLKYGAVMALLKGPLSFKFWVFEILLGSLIPFFILIFPGALTLKRGVTAAFLVIIGMFFIRYDMVVAGQIYPAWGGDYALYSPNHLEWFIVIACLGACLLFYTLGVKFLPLREKEH